MTGYTEGKGDMLISERKLRKIIREAIQGTAAGPNKGKSFLELTMNAVEAGDHAKAAGYILDSYMIDDLSAEDEDRLVDALKSLPPDVRDSDLERVADKWFKSFRGESGDKNRQELMDALQKEYKLRVRTTEDFDGTPGGVWIAAETEDAKTSDGMPLFDYQYDDEPYVFGVHEEFEDFLKPYGYFPEWHDPGTLMLYEV